MRESKLQVSVLEGTEEFAALRPEWDELHETADQVSVFTTWEWQHHWWLAYGAGKQLRVLVVRDAGHLLGILPLHIRETPVLRHARCRVLRLVATGEDTFPDDLGPILAIGREAEVARALAQAVMELPGWDVLLLTDLIPNLPFLEAIDEAAKGQPVSRGLSQRIPYVDLPPSWEDFLRSLSRERRHRVRSRRRKIDSELGTRFFVWMDAANLDQAVRRLIELHSSRWRSVGVKHSFSSPEYIQLHQSVIRALIGRDGLRLYCLEGGGEIIAMSYCYRFRGKVFFMQAGFDVRHARLHPGEVLLGYALEHAIGEGNRVFDFLRGEHQYKEDLATAHRETVRRVIYRPGYAAQAYRLGHEYAPALKGAVKAALGR